MAADAPRPADAAVLHEDGTIDIRKAPGGLGDFLISLKQDTHAVAAWVPRKGAGFRRGRIRDKEQEARMMFVAGLNKAGAAVPVKRLASERSKGVWAGVIGKGGVEVLTTPPSKIDKVVEVPAGVYVISSHKIFTTQGSAVAATMTASTASPGGVDVILRVDDDETAEQPEFRAVIKRLFLQSGVRIIDPTLPGVEEAEPRITRDTREWRDRFIAEYQPWTSSEVALQHGSEAKNTSALANRWLKEGKVFAVQYRGVHRFPMFQFKDGVPLPVMADVIRCFPTTASGWDLAFFLTTPNSYVGLELPYKLLQRDPSRVVSLAKAFVSPADAF